MGFRSLVGDMGTTLSGGQQQRVMLARALYRQPKLLVMDEGTSAMDVALERRVNAALKSLDATRIIAAHRPETLASADRVMALQNGHLQQIKFELRPVTGTNPQGAGQTDPSPSSGKLFEDALLFENER